MTMRLLGLAVGVWLTLTGFISPFGPKPKVTAPQPAGSRLRLLVLTDIEADPDDSQSLIRLLTYANQFDIEGLIATTSIHQKKRVAPETIHALLDRYGQVQPNLLKHEAGYPTAALLHTKVKRGLPVCGMDGVGEGRHSEGADWLLAVLEKPDPRPLWVSVWGGPNVLAQTLWTIRKTKSPADAQRLYRKLRVYTISDQDDTGPWIRQQFPDVFFIASPGYTYRQATWRGINMTTDGANNDVISNDWLARSIQQGHGVLGAAYPDVAYGMEGDSPAFMGLIANGLNAPDQPDYGGWGGRYVLEKPAFVKTTDAYGPNWPADLPETRPLWTNAADSLRSPVDQKNYWSNQATIWRWRQAFQHDFAARMDWCTRAYKDANHPPAPALAHPTSLTVRSGEQFHLNATGTTDPDGDSVSYLWFQYPEAGSYPGHVSFRPYAANLYDLPVTAPVVSQPQTIHFILSVTDKGTPALTRYKRVIVWVTPG